MNELGKSDTPDGWIAGLIAGRIGKRMDGQAGWTAIQPVRRIDGRTGAGVRQTARQTDGQAGGRTGRRTDERTAGLTDGRAGGRADGRMNGRTDG